MEGSYILLGDHFAMLFDGQDFCHSVLDVIDENEHHDICNTKQLGDLVELIG